jgi:hypothetical protein
MSRTSLNPLWSESAVDKYRASSWKANGDVLLVEWCDEEPSEFVQMSNARLLELAERNQPPQAWLDGDEEDLF